ncbi:hypothetical protein [Nakamurella aerolata]|uniref:Uncharacterized protein n=1 Tax=Nakamurella aerolata TaxID=1656892 RepID=A0A849A8T1_9ACTN|nr:hypothetical protein [Nakamurella aerolata]NNG35943.1 hypothetical protein [Nakamurella aerolata]
MAPTPAGPNPGASPLPVPPLARTALADRLVHPYRMSPWCAGTMFAVALPLLTMLNAVAIPLLAKLFNAAGDPPGPELTTDEADTLSGIVLLAGAPAVYLAVAAAINAWRFGRLRRRLRQHYQQLLARPDLLRDPALRPAVAAMVTSDAEVYRQDRRRHVLRKVGAVFGGLLELLSLFAPGGGGGGGGAAVTGVRSGQFGYKLCWGLAALLAVTVPFLVLHPGDRGYLLACLTVAAVQALWWVPALWRSRALRSVDEVWKRSLTEVCAIAGLPVPAGPSERNFRR